MALPETVKAGRKMQSLEERITDARQERDAAIRARFAEGVNMAQIAREVGLSRQQVFHLLRQAS